MDFLDAVAEGRLWVVDIDHDGDQPGTLFADRLWPLKRGGIVWVYDRATCILCR